MNDDFIYRALPNVREEFAQSLYEKISGNTRAISRPGIFPAIRGARRLQFAILLGVLLLIAWSQVRLWIRYVPIGDLWLVEFSLTQPATGVQTLGPIPTPGPLPMATIRGMDGIDIIVMGKWRLTQLSPDWIPAGFSTAKISGSGYSFQETIGMWSNDAGETIRLYMVLRPGGAHPYAPPGMYREVYVNGQPAILVYGRLAPNSPENPQAQRKWDETLGLQLTWSLEDSIYTLETSGPYVTEDDLIRMAESMNTVPHPWESTTP